MPRQPGQHRFKAHAQLLRQPARVFLRPLFSPRFREGRLLRGRPSLYFGVSGAAGFTGFSRASIAVLSREICPTSRSPAFAGAGSCESA